jgi:hypothetical protein
MSRDTCPNCGNHMGLLHEQRQQAGPRQIRLRWVICSHCHHVALDEWSFIDSEPPVSPEPPRQPCTARSESLGDEQADRDTRNRKID